MHLQLVELLRDLLILPAQTIKLLFVLTHSVQQLRVSSLSREELLHDLLNVTEARLCSDLLECTLDLGGLRHLSVHLVLEELGPEFLSQEVFVHLELVRVLIVIGSLVPDLLLPRVPLDAPLKGRLLVVEGLQH